MTNTAKLYNNDTPERILGKARILRADNKKRTAKIYIESLSGIQEIHATIATSFNVELNHDDEVLVLGDDLDNIFIIGILSSKSSTKIHSKDGAYALLDDTTGKQSLQIFSNQNELIVEYDTEKNKTKVQSGSGNLEFTLPKGSIAFQSAESLTFKANTINFEGNNKINLAVRDLPGNSASSFSLGRYQARMNSPDLRLTAKNGTIFFNELKIAGKTLFGNLGNLTLKAGKLETNARSIINKAKNMYQTVENLSQLKTGRLKTLIKSSYHIKSKKTVMKSEEDFKIKAERIDLG